MPPTASVSPQDRLFAHAEKPRTNKRRTKEMALEDWVEQSTRWRENAASVSPFGLHPQKKGSVLQARRLLSLFAPAPNFFSGPAESCQSSRPRRAPHVKKINQAQSSGGPIFDEQSGVIMLSPDPRNQEPGGSAFIPCCPVAWTLVSRADQPRKRPAVGSSPPLFVALLGDRSGSSCSAKGPAHDGAHPLSSVNR